MRGRVTQHGVRIGVERKPLAAKTSKSVPHLAQTVPSPSFFIHESTVPPNPSLRKSLIHRYAPRPLTWDNWVEGGHAVVETAVAGARRLVEVPAKTAL